LLPGQNLDLIVTPSPRPKDNLRVKLSPLTWFFIVVFNIGDRQCQQKMEIIYWQGWANRCPRFEDERRGQIGIKG
jgi:hypothetical protein